jgi:hypothetical protein
MAEQLVYWAQVNDPNKWAIVPEPMYRTIQDLAGWKPPFDAVANRQWLIATFGLKAHG